MSWLSELFGGGDDPVAAEMARQRAEERRIQEARAYEEQQKAKTKAEQEAFRTGAAGVGRNSALQYFSNLGLDPNQFAGDIDSEIAKVLGTTALDDPNIGSYLADLGQSVYQTREGALRNKSLRDIDMMFQPEFERQRIGETVDDPILAEINAAERGEAESYIDNLLRRGVITEAGRAGAARNLDEQGARVRGILDEIGRTTLAGGREGLSNIANRGRQTASTLKLGQSFDPSVYGSEADTASNEFISRLGDSLRGQVVGDLYDTSGLAAIAGAAQGAGNTRFDPNALAGSFQEPEDDDEEDTPLGRRRPTF